MKKIIIVTIVFLFITPFVIAQNTPQGMKYQAVARDISGDILANQDVILKIKLQSNANSNKEHYSEVHKAKTNQFGLFSLVIGEGQVENGVFTEIPWSTQDIWMTIDIKDKNKSNFKNISSSKLLAVPYAFHAATASKVINEKNTYTKGPGKTGGVPSQNWSLFGNSKTDPEKDKLGTTDAADLVLVTNNIERSRITADGEIITGDGKFTIGGNLEIQGEETKINKDLFVGRDVFLNDSDDFTPRGETINYGNFTVERTSATLLTGTLEVFNETLLKNTLTVLDDVSIEDDLTVKSTLRVIDDVTFEDDLTVNNTLRVINDGTFEDDLKVKNNLTVEETLFAKTIVTDRLKIVDNVTDGEYLATYENTNDNYGDGIKIKLGKTHPMWDGSAIVEAINPLADYFDENIENIRDAITGEDEFTIQDVAKLIPTELLAGTVCNLLETLTEKLNVALNLPLLSRDIAVAVNGCDPYNPDGTINTTCTVFDQPSNSYFWDDDWVPKPGEGFELIPKLPEVFCEKAGLKGIKMPNISFTNVNNSLTIENHYIDFTDKDDRSLGYIRAVSITEWGEFYFDGLWLSQFMQKSVGLDILDAITGLVNVGSQVVEDYNNIGVEYASGNGDYAEWLERLDPNEFISKGDIVGVIAGKITKNLENAEQIMAISEKPIMLGNIPEKSKEYLGNNVAFMGQIPVKVIGEVSSGDYIIANNEVPGYGIAKRPTDVTIDDTKYIVGRSWQTNLSDGPKMVNTVIGVHNGDYLKIIKKFQDEFNSTVERLENLEAKVDVLINNDLTLRSN